MHAVVVREMVAADRIEESKAPLENVVPRVQQSPGIVGAYWTITEEGHALNLLVFESEEAATAALARIRGRTTASVRPARERRGRRGPGELLTVGRGVGWSPRYHPPRGTDARRFPPRRSINTLAWASRLLLLIAVDLEPVADRPPRTSAEVGTALARLRNIPAELAGLHQALSHLPDGTAATCTPTKGSESGWNVAGRRRTTSSRPSSQRATARSGGGP